MAQVLFTNLTEEQADELVSWFVNSGEQAFYDNCQDRPVRVTLADARKTFSNGKANRNENGDLVVVMQQFTDEDLEE